MKFIFYSSLSPYVKRILRKALKEHMNHRGSEYNITLDGGSVYITVKGKRPAILVRGGTIVKGVI